MRLYIRNKSRWINFIHNIDEFNSFQDSHLQGRSLVIGDLSQFSRPMMYRLLKFIEENPEVDCYSSRDLNNPILLSRFTEVIKDPLIITQNHSIEDFNNSAKDYGSACMFLAQFSSDTKLRVSTIKPQFFKLIEAING